MAYSENILPKSAAYYSLNRASIDGSYLNIEAGGYAEINISKQMLPTLTSKMLVVAHPSVFSDYYTNDTLQITLSVITPDGEYVEFLIPVSEHTSGVFNTEIELPEGEYLLCTYRISSLVDVTVYNWELCAEDIVEADVSGIIDGVEQALPRLLYDYNIYAYSVGQEEITVGLISCYLQQATDLQGHFTLSFFATERCNVHVRIKDNGITELYTPQVYTVEKGYASISIPHAYLAKHATDHAFYVTVQCTNGQLSIPVRGMLYTIDGGHLATRLLDAGIDVLDISVRQLSTDVSPSEIWALGYEGNRILLKRREYSSSMRANWTAVKDFGEALDAAVEFRAAWTLRSSSNKYTMDTEQTPYVFIVDTFRDLLVYSGSSYETVVKLDSGVSDVSACQGFNSMYYVEQDQGLVVAYIKDGNVYYRQYAYSASDQKAIWDSSELLYDGGDAAHVNVHRLPDYRIGICVNTTDNGTKWYITSRTYVGQAIKPEIVRISNGRETYGLIGVFDVDRLNEVSTAPTMNTYEVPEEAILYDTFILAYTGTLYMLCGKTLESFLSSNIKVSVNGTTLASNAFTAKTQGTNTIVVTLKTPVSGGTKVVVTVSNAFMAIKQYNNTSSLAESGSYTWNLPNPVRNITVEEESVTVSVTASVSPVVRELLTSVRYETEAVDVNVTPTLDLVVREIITTNQNINEEVSISASATIDVAVTLVGTAPV